MADPDQSREFDIIVFGATGYTGGLIAEYLLSNYGAETSIAIAGRNESKLQALAATFEHAPKILVGDSSDLDTMRAIAGRARLVVSCTGPFLLYGSNMVQACAELGTDYVDVTGEVYWSGQMMAAHEDAAKQSGARIISFCGFDSVPSDLGVYLLQKAAIAERGKPFGRVKMRVKSLRGGGLGGSKATSEEFMARAKTKPEMLAFMADPFALCSGFRGPEQPSGMQPQFDEELDSWAAPFLMHPINSKVVHRTNALLGQLYGKGFLYDEASTTGPGEAGKAAIADKIKTLSGFDPDGASPDLKPGDGPDKATREAGYYTISIYGIDGGEVAGQIDISDNRDPGGGSTCKLVGESAMCLLTDGIAVGGGFWTPVSAMGDQLATRLKAKHTISISEPQFSPA